MSASLNHFLAISLSRLREFHQLIFTTSSQNSTPFSEIAQISEDLQEAAKIPDVWRTIDAKNVFFIAGQSIARQPPTSAPG